MKKLFILGMCGLIAACTTTTFMPYDGAKIEMGTGGFAETMIDGMSFYQSGLPANKDCKTIGQVSTDVQPGGFFKTSRDPIYRAVADKAVPQGGNTAVLLKRDERVSGSTTNYTGAGYKIIGIGTSSSTNEYEEFNTFMIYNCK
ncbi:MAG: hypothetical protein LBL75_02800 [Rickettsiales bacterium]|jgi:hypothetical protein|nr:hypothetical protein [Rickettsiales bacterium]